MGKVRKVTGNGKKHKTSVREKDRLEVSGTAHKQTFAPKWGQSMLARYNNMHAYLDVVRMV